MAIREKLHLSFEITTTGGSTLAPLEPDIDLSESYDESVAVYFDLPPDDVYYEINEGLVETVTMVLLAMSGEFTVRLNDDANLVIPAKDLWIYRSDTDLTKLEVKNPGTAAGILRGFILGT